MITFNNNTSINTITTITGLDPTGAGSANRQENDAMLVALVSSVSTFVLTFVFTFIIGFLCGACFIKKCKKPDKTTESPHHERHNELEEVLTTHKEQREKAVKLQQNVAYTRISLHMN